MNKLLMLLMLVLGLFGCAGNRARKEVNPLAVSTWTNVQVDYQRGIDSGVAGGALTPSEADVLVALGDRLSASLANADYDALSKVPWVPKMEPWALRGIDAELAAGELGPNGAEILRQRVQNFTELVLLLQGKAVKVTSVWTSREHGSSNEYIRTPAERRWTAEVAR